VKDLAVDPSSMPHGDETTSAYGHLGVRTAPDLTHPGETCMIKRFNERIRQREYRRFFVVFLGGKLVGVGVALLAAKYFMGILGSKAYAQSAADVPQEQIINATNTVWV